MIECSQAQTRKRPSDISQFSKPCMLQKKKYLKDNKHNSLNLAQKYAQIFVLGHYGSSQMDCTTYTYVKCLCCIHGQCI